MVNSNVTIGTSEAPQRITVTGDVHLILADGCNFTVNGGIQVNDDDLNITNGSANKLTIYGQESGTGMLIADANYSADMNHFNAGIGGGLSETLETLLSGAITINGGIVEATSQRGAGIGGGREDYSGNVGSVTINGGTLSIENGGTLTNNGKIYVDGTFKGTADNLYYPLTLVKASATDITSVYNGKTYGKAGSTITLSATPQAGKIITWDSSPSVNISGNSFIMPKEALEVTAQWIDCLHDGTLTHTPAVAPTYSEYGVKEYWQCNMCNVYLSDNVNKTVITDLDNWKTGDGRIGKLTVSVPVKSDTVSSDEEGNVTVTIEKSIVTVNGKTEVTVSDSIADTIIAKLASYKLVARSMTCKSPSGKKAIRIRVYDKNGLEVDFFDELEIYRSIKRNSGYGKKPIFVTKSGKSSYYNTAIKSGTRYYYRVRGFVIIDGEWWRFFAFSNLLSAV